MTINTTDKKRNDAIAPNAAALHKYCHKVPPNYKTMTGDGESTKRKALEYRHVSPQNSVAEKLDRCDRDDREPWQPPSITSG